MKKQLMARLAALGSMLMVGNHALATGTAVDVTSVTDTITAQLTPIGLVGAAVLGLIVVVKAYKWIRRAF